MCDSCSIRAYSAFLFVTKLAEAYTTIIFRFIPQNCFQVEFLLLSLLFSLYIFFSSSFLLAVPSIHVQPYVHKYTQSLIRIALRLVAVLN